MVGDGGGHGGVWWERCAVRWTGSGVIESSVHIADHRIGFAIIGYLWARHPHHRHLHPIISPYAIVASNVSYKLFFRFIAFRCSARDEHEIRTSEVAGNENGPLDWK